LGDWLYGAVDLLASEYGWSFRDILFKIYPEDFFLLARQIQMRKLDEHLMQLNIAANPHREASAQQEFINDLLGRHRSMRGEEAANAQLDVAAFEKIRSKLGKESMLVKVK
jgi:hypothetical protein